MTQREELMIARVERESLNYGDCGGYRRQSERSLGCSRAVRLYSGDGYILKVNKTRMPDGEGSCAAEWEFYTGTTDIIRERLAKPLYVSANRQAIAMEIVRPCDEFNDGSPRDDREKLRDFFTRELGEAAAGLLMHDDGIFNFAYRDDGMFVLMDYGHLPYGIPENGDLDFRQRLRLFMGCVSV